jgi:transposase
VAAAAAAADDGQAGWQVARPPPGLNSILFRTHSGIPWRDLPERYGPWQTVYKRFARWERDGTWARIEAHLRTQADEAAELDWDAQIDWWAAAGL